MILIGRRDEARLKRFWRVWLWEVYELLKVLNDNLKVVKKS